MPSFYDIFPDAETIFELEPEELAGNILFYLRQQDENTPPNQPSNLHYQDLTIPQGRQDLENRRRELERFTREAWSWLEVQGLLVPEPGPNGDNGFRFLSRRAKQIENEQDFQRYKSANKLPKEILHDRMRQRVWSCFVRGEYDAAVFEAMKAVEVYVREAAGFDRSQYGVSMMRRAFNEEGGPLTDDSLETAEKQSVGHLFAGSYGYFRNPSAHHEVPLNSPAEAMEIVLLANHLLRIVDAAAERNNGEES